MTESTPEHIHVSSDERTVCGTDRADEDARVVPDDRDPIVDSSIHLCPDCAVGWESIASEVKREKTVQCACDRIEDGHVWKCGEVVPVSVARALRHPDVDDEMVPICPDCYEWVRSQQLNEVDTPIEDAATWAELKCLPE